MANSITIILEDGHGGFTVGQTQTPALKPHGRSGLLVPVESSSATATGAT